MQPISLIFESILKSIERRHPRPIICHRLKLLYYPVAKVASSSIRRYIFEHEYLQSVTEGVRLEESYADFQFPRIQQKDASKYVKSGYTTFAVVRNPYERICSCYRDKILGAAKRGRLHQGFQRYNRLAPFPIFKEDMSFDSFIRTISKIPDFASDAHFRSQATFIPHSKNTILLDHIIKLENFNNEFSKLVKELGLPAWTTTQENRSSPEKSLLHSYPDTIPLIKKRYRQSFRLLLYDPEEIPNV